MQAVYNGALEYTQVSIEGNKQACKKELESTRELTMICSLSQVAEHFAQPTTLQ